MYRKGLAYRRRAKDNHKNRRVYIGTQCLMWSSLATDVRAQGRLAKGKIHCSCPMCSNKSTKCLNKTTNSLKYYSASDKRKFEKLNYSYEEYISA